MLNLLKSSMRSPDKYYLQKRLKGSQGPVNALAFNRGATLIASGGAGDDEVVRLWDTGTGNEHQKLLDLTGRWGQITCLAFVYPEQLAVALSPEWVFFGSGRGMFLLYQRERDMKEFVQILNKDVFGAGDSVEAFDYNLDTRQLAITSHYGHISLYSLFDAELSLIWSKILPDCIPRAVQFQRGFNRVIVFGLETGKLTFFDVDTALETNAKVLSSAIGNVAVCPVSGGYLIDNMVNGFDLYPPNRTSPVQTFEVSVSKKYVKQVAFAEKGKLAVCGSDHGLAYIFDVNLSGIPQRLSHGKRDEFIQTIESTSANGRHFIATGSSGGNFDICIWQRFAAGRKRRSNASEGLIILMTANVVLLFSILGFVTSDKWVPPTVQTVRALVPEFEEAMGMGPQEISVALNVAGLAVPDRSSLSVSTCTEGACV